MHEKASDISPLGGKPPNGLRHTPQNPAPILMLRITPSAGIDRAKSYFTESLSRGDYYTEGQELAGVWGGKLAASLGLTGAVEQQGFHRLCENRHPATGEPLTQRTLSNRRVGYDINWHPPKSLSVQFGLTGEPEILTRFEEAVSYTMGLLETDVQTRVRKGGENTDRTTGNLVWSSFTHLTARPVGGVPDPHLHSHCFTFNATFDQQENVHKAIQLGNVKREAEFYQAAFHARLRQNMEEIGYSTRTTKDGKSFELAHVTEEIIATFSRRTRDIEAMAKEKGIVDANRKAELGARTREKKAKGYTLDELRSMWRSRLTEEQLNVLASGKGKPRSKAWIVEQGGQYAAQAIEFARAHSFERDSVVREKTLLKTALTHAQDKATLEQLTVEFEKQQLVGQEIEGIKYVTTPAMLAEEQSIVDFVRSGLGKYAPFSQRHDFSETPLSPAQRSAACSIVGSEDQVILMRGAAGTGKTFLMRQVVAEIERSQGGQVFVTAPTIDAAEMLKQDGFAGGQTIQRLLVNQRAHARLKNGTLWIDEIGLVGTRTMGAIFKLAEQQNARLILTGDEKQHHAVLRGSPMRLLRTSGVVPVELTAIRRQQGDYQRIVHKISQGCYSAAFADLDRKGWVKEMPQLEAHQEIAQTVRQAIVRQKCSIRSRPLVISPTHEEKNELTQTIRDELFAARWLSGKERTFSCLESLQLTEAQRQLSSSFQEGRVVCFYQNMVGFKAGTRATVDHVDGRGNVWMHRFGQSQKFALNIEQPERFDIFAKVRRPLAIGDPLRITSPGKTKNGIHALRSGSEYEVKGFDGSSGDIVLMNGWTVSKNFGHWDLAYVATSYASQGKTTQQVLIAQAAQSFGATNAEQFYVSVSRAKQQALIFTDDKKRLGEKIKETECFKNASDLDREAEANPLPPLQRREHDERKRQDDKERQPSL